MPHVSQYFSTNDGDYVQHQRRSFVRRVLERFSRVASRRLPWSLDARASFVDSPTAMTCELVVWCCLEASLLRLIVVVLARVCSVERLLRFIDVNVPEHRGKFKPEYTYEVVRATLSTFVFLNTIGPSNRRIPTILSWTTLST